MLDIQKTLEDGAALFRLEGRLDTVTAPKLEKELRETMAGISRLTLDMEKLEYISSAGLRVLLTAQKTMNRQGEMKVAHVPEMILEIFEVTGFTEILTIE
ncbi:MAG: STAS domain-containing protein [Lachnospiraceae bacterium]|nr:STAS domain-containing protein [Lachnospiraceae bacterium]